MHVIDWMPTFAQLVDFSTGADANWDGKNTWPNLLAEPSSSEPREFYFVWHQDRIWEGLRHGDWKIVRSKKKNAANPGPWMLFNLSADASETADRAAERPDLVADLSARFAAHFAQDNHTPSSPTSAD